MELRLDEPEGETPKLSGYIAVFNQLSEDFGGWREQIAPGAFADSIARDDIRGLWNHDSDLVLGRLQSGTLALREDETGLAFENSPPDTTWFRDRLVSLRRKDVTGSSFGFYTDEDEWKETPQEDGTRMKLRTLKKLTLVEVSPGVTFPAYPQTSTEAAQRSMTAWIEMEKARGTGHTAADLVGMDLRRRRLQLQRQVL
jgi:hypothetical protein